LEELFQEIEQCLEEMIRLQREKVFMIAIKLNSSITRDDLFNPQDFVELERSGLFNFEDGILAGLMSAQMALRANVFSKHRH
jgi:hypothetical protein